MPQSVSPRNQSFYHLACIQSVSLGLSVVIIGKQLADTYGTGTAICSIFIGNLILWLIGLAIISTVYQAHMNAIENIKGYFGEIGGILFALVLVFAFLTWYALQINSSIIGLRSLFQTTDPWSEGTALRLGAAMGVLAAMLAVGGIRLLKVLTTITFPPILIYNIYIVLASDYSNLSATKYELSLPAIIITILTLLPGVINLPTFFRHSRSKVDSYLALTIMTIAITFLECASIWMNFTGQLEFIAKNNVAPSFFFFVVPTALFIILTSICSNLLNIYLASACYESFIPKFEGTKGHAIMGLLGTATFTFIQISAPIEFIQNLFNCYIGVIGTVLLISALVRLIIKHRPRMFEKIINLCSGLVGSAVATVLVIQNPQQGVQSLLLSMGASVLFFLIVFFVEENVWAIQKIKSKAQKSGN